MAPTQGNFHRQNLQRTGIVPKDIPTTFLLTQPTAAIAAAAEGLQLALSPSLASRITRYCSRSTASFVFPLCLPLRRGMSDSEVDTQTRFQFKYGCLHSVFGTPQVFVGGVLADGLDGEATFEDWQDLLDPLLGGTAVTAKLNGRAAKSIG